MNETRLTFGKRLDWIASALVSLQLQSLALFLTCNRYKIVSFCAATRYTLRYRYLSGSQFLVLALRGFLLFFWFCFYIFMSLPPTKSRRKSPVQCNFACNSLWCHKLCPLKWNFNCCCRIIIIVGIIIASQEARRARIERLTCTFPTAPSGMGFSYFTMLFFARKSA